jgi:hypothetical protein
VTGAAPVRAQGSLAVLGSLSVLAAVLAIAALVGVSRAATPPQAPFVAVGIASATAREDRTVLLTVDIQNATPADVRGTVRVVARTGEDAGAWEGELRAVAEGRGRVEVAVPDACGDRLTLTAEAPGLARQLTFRVPCPPGAAP